MSLETLSNVKTRLGITGTVDDPALNLMLNSADAFVTEYCDRDFQGGAFIEYFAGGGFAILRNRPIDSVIDVRVDPSRAFGSTTIVDPGSYIVNPERGTVQSVVGPFVSMLASGLTNSHVEVWSRAPKTVRIEYTTAMNAVPESVKQAYARLVGHWYRKLKTESGNNFVNVAQQKFGDTFSIFSAQGNEGAPVEVLQMLDPFRASIF
jgi:hypothetical protein